MKAAFKLLLLFFMLGNNLWASTALSPWYSQDSDKKTIINVELFLSSTCTHCHHADAFFREIEPAYPWLHVTRYEINKNKEALVRFNELQSEQKMTDFAVPSVFFCSSRWVGFASAQTTGKDLLHALNYCKQQIEKKGTLTPEHIEVLRHWANANLFDSGMTENPTVVKYITVMALMDAFNPCALFCLGGFFAFLFIRDASKDQLVTGMLFIVTVGLMHYFQQAYTNAFFELLPWLRGPAIIVGLFTLYVMVQYYRKKEMGNLLLLLSLFIAFFLQAYQQTCLMNWSFIFEQWLANQQLSNGRAMAYELAFQLMYLVPLTGALIVYVAVMKLDRLTAMKQKLKYIGILYLMVIASMLIIYPWVFSKLLVSLMILFIVPIAGLLFIRFNHLLEPSESA